jgi:hypothetical protein
VRKYWVARDVVAGCFVCWGSDGHWHSKNAQALAARHHDATGHQTWADVNMSVIYGEKKDDKRQLSFPTSKDKARGNT